MNRHIRSKKCIVWFIGMMAQIIVMCSPLAAQSDVVALLPLSGPQAEFGIAVKHGLELAFEGSGLQVVFEDHRGKPADAASAFESTVSRYTPGALVVFGSNTALAIAQKAQDRSIPTIAIATSDLIQKDRPKVFRHMLSSVVSAELLEGEVRRRGLTSIAAVTTIHDGMLAFKDSFIARLATPPIADVQVESGESDFKAIALSLHRKRPAGIFIGLLPPQAALFARAIRALGYKGELFASNQIDMPSELVAGGKAFDGLWFSRDGAKRDPEFLARYQERYKGVPATFALNGYDVGVLIRTGSKEGDLVQYLSNLTRFNGALGTYSAKSDRTFSIPGSLWTLSDGEARMME